MDLLSLHALVLCPHVVGRVALHARQHFVRIAGQPVLVQGDPEHKTITGCPHAAPGNPPCLHTLEVREGHSALVRIDGRPVCLDSVSGLTDGHPPGTHRYFVKHPGQRLVRSRA